MIEFYGRQETLLLQRPNHAKEVKGTLGNSKRNLKLVSYWFEE